MVNIINKTMSRQDLMCDDAEIVIRELDKIITQLYDSGLFMSSWVGTVPNSRGISKKEFFRKFTEKIGLRIWPSAAGDEDSALKAGMAQRLDYIPLPNAADDLRIPWFLYWEIYWVLKITGPYLKSGMKLLDAGGTSSLFTCYLASLGFDMHSVDLNERLKENGELIARTMKWNMRSYAMDLMCLGFPDEAFDHAYSICVFEHLDYEIKQAAMAEIARCLKPGGIFSISFDYRNPAPAIAGFGKDTRSRNSLKTVADIKRSFLTDSRFELMGNQDFYDNCESYLMHPRFGNAPYTFGAIFLRKKSDEKN